MKKYRLTALSIVAITILSMVKLPKMVVSPEVKVFELGLDKWHHALAYMLLTFVFLCEFKGQKSVRNLFLTLLSFSALGVLMEIIQLLLPYRTFNPYDVIANMVGILIVVLIHYFYCRKKTSNN